jgi:hypothetical protein
MIIKTARYQDPSKRLVIVDTVEEGEVAICLPPHNDNTAGLRAAYERWIADGNKVEEPSE